MNGTNLFTAQMSTMCTSGIMNSALTTPPVTIGSSLPAALDPAHDPSSRYAAGTALAAFGIVLAGCSETRPAPIANESAIPPNQSNCTPASTSAYCTSQREVLAEMHRMREEGHHSDQSLFFISGGIALVLGITVGLVVGMRRGRKKAERAAAQNQAALPPPPAPEVKAAGTPKTETK